MKKNTWYIPFILSTIFTSWLCWCGTTLAANPIIDSLWLVYEQETTDTGKINALLSLTDAYIQEDLDSAKIVATVALEKAATINDQRIIGGIYYKLAHTYHNYGLLDESRKYDSLALASYKKADYKPGIVDMWIVEGVNDRLLGRIENAEIYLNKSIALSKEIDYKKGLVSAYSELAQLYFYDFNRREEASKFVEEAIDIFETLDEKAKTRIVRAITEIYFLKGRLQEDYYEAALAFIKGLEIGKKYNDKLAQIGGHLHLGWLYKKLQKYPEAFEYGKEVLELSKSSKNIYPILEAYALLNALFFEQKQYEEAINICEESLTYAINSPDIYHLILIDLAINYFQSDSINAALEIVEKIDTSLFYGYKPYTSRYDFLKAKLFIAEQKWEDALMHIERVNQPTSLLDYSDRLQVLECLQSIHQNLGNYQQVLKYTQLEQEVRDSLFNQQKIITTQRIILDYETEKKENAIQLLKKENAFQQVQLDVQHYWSYIWTTLGGGSLLLCSLFFLLYWRNSQIASKEAVLRKNMQNLFYNISHEFKTPLSVLKIPLEELTKNELSGNIRQVYQLMLRQIHRLSDMTTQMMELVQLKDKQRQINLKYSDPEDFIRTLVGQFEVYAAQKNINLILRIPNRSLPIYFDAEVLARILNNLIDNAIKFTEKGTVKVTLHYKLKFLEIEVSDTGKGMQKEALKYIFEQHYLNPLNENRASNTGLGLSIVKELVDLYSGHIQVVSEYDKGSTFTVFLPHHKIFSQSDLPRAYKELFLTTNTDSPNITPLDSIISKRLALNHKQKKILIVEDNIDLNGLIYNRLAQKYLVYQAYNGVEGYEMAKRIVPDIILTDIMMEQMNGLSLARELQTSKETDHIPLIVFSALSEEQKKITALETGAIEFLAKPLNIRALESKITNLLSYIEKLRERFQKWNWVIVPETIAQIGNREAFLLRLRKVVLDNMSNTELDATLLSEQLFVSKAILYHKVKSMTGISPTNLIYKIKIQYAYELLKHQEKSLPEIAKVVGIDNLSFFKQKFQEEYAISPTRIPEWN